LFSEYDHSCLQSCCSRALFQGLKSNSSKPHKLARIASPEPIYGLETFLARIRYAIGRRPPSVMQAPAFGQRRPRYIAVDLVDVGRDLISPHHNPLPTSPPPLSPQFLAASRTHKPRRAQIRPACATNMAESSSIGRGGGHIGRDGSSRGRGRGHGDEEEEKKRRSTLRVFVGHTGSTSTALSRCRPSTNRRPKPTAVVPSPHLRRRLPGAPSMMRAHPACPRRQLRRPRAWRLTRPRCRRVPPDRGLAQRITSSTRPSSASLS
jgi:hypothetical protein